MANVSSADEGLRELALFAGAGGGILGGHLLGWRTVCAVEWEPYPASVLVARQNEGVLPPFPIWDDVRTFDGRPWRGRVDVVSGGFPCQDISTAGKGGGLSGERSGLWREMARIIREVRPRYVFVENSPVLTSRGLDRVLGDLAEAGYDASWGVLSAADVGAPHIRKRIWIVAADADGAAVWHAEQRSQTGRVHVRDGGVANPCDDGEARDMADAYGSDVENVRNGRAGIHARIGAVDDPKQISVLPSNRRSRKKLNVADASGERLQKPSGEDVRGARRREEGRLSSSGSWWQSEPDVGRVAHGVAARVDRLKSIGNGQVSLVAATAWRQLLRRLEG